MNGNLELPEFIGYVVDQLLVAREQARKRTSHVLRLHECEIEIALTAKKEGTGGVKAWVVEAGGSASVEHVHQMKVKFTPVSPAEVFETGEASAAAPPTFGGPTRA
jgi:hypothetical protein